MAKVHYFKDKQTGRVFGTECPSTYETEHMRQFYEKIGRADGEQASIEQARQDLRAILKPGDTVYCVLRHVSQSGMQRRISLFAAQVDENGKAHVRNIDGLTSTITSMRNSDKGGLILNGCGMDMGFDAVYRLGYCLWPDGTPEPHGRRNGEPDSDGGYALKHSWL